MVDGDVFREVEEELRKERALAVWQRYGVFIVGGAIGIIAAVTGWQAWQYYQQQQANAAGSKFEGAIVLEEDGKADESRKILEDLAKTGPGGYKSLAQFRLAGELAESGKKAEAVAAYDALAKASTGDESLRTFAVVRAAMLRVDDAPFEEMNTRLGKLTAGDSAWRHTARELLGLSAYKNGKKAEAEKIYQEVLIDNGATGALRQRAQVMLSLLAEPVTPKTVTAPKAETSTGTTTGGADGGAGDTVTTTETTTQDTSGAAQSGAASGGDAPAAQN